uniref:DNA replication ATP-dependent helicase/nuclease n=1 Tax=Mucochytrium quahogii TaxID=96639 RepID=A0A7S2S4F0_9STRA|mmetsp:Transcript_31646/g.50531  ORF Transcript_31646/g.50531 Transcript_31646/m.50531 type:complete len:1470 (+) Transcript_31646:242-4651(+)
MGDRQKKSPCRSTNAVSWGRSPRTGQRHVSRCQGVEADSEISKLGGVLANVQAQIAAKKRDRTLSTTPSKGESVCVNGEKMLLSWLVEETQTCEKSVSSSPLRKKIFPVRKKGKENDEPCKYIDTGNKENHNDKLLNMLDKLKDQIDTHSSVVVKKVKNAKSLEVLNPICANTGENTLQKSGPLLPVPTTSKNVGTVKRKLTKQEIAWKRKEAKRRLELTRKKKSLAHNIPNTKVNPRKTIVIDRTSHRSNNGVTLKPQQYAGCPSHVVSKKLKQTKLNLAGIPSSSTGTQPKHIAPIYEVSSDSDDDDLLFELAAKFDGSNGRKPMNVGSRFGNVNNVLPNSSESCGDSYTRFKVVDVVKMVDSLTLEVTSRPGKHSTQVHLKSQWVSTPVKAGDYINIIWTSDDVVHWRDLERIVVDEFNNYIIVCPDLLISPTRIVSVLACLRRAVLADHVSSFEASKSTVLGKIKHEVVERALMPIGDPQRPRFDKDYLEAVIDKVLRKPQVIDELFSVNVSESRAKVEVVEAIPALQSFSKKYIHVNATQNQENVPLASGESGRFNIQNVVATEEKMWSPKWGLLGQPDFLVNATIDGDSFMFPLELKTGRPREREHHAQVLLYSLLLGDRYQGMRTSGSKFLPNIAGMLMYVSHQNGNASEPGKDTASVRCVSRGHALLRDLIQRRNEFAAATSPHWLQGQKNDDEQASSLSSKIPVLPPVLQNEPYTCERCYEKSTCMRYHRALDDGTPETSGIDRDDFNKITAYISKPQLAYLKLWDNLIDLETVVTNSTQREIWTKTGAERELRGKCVSSMRLTSVERKSCDELSESFLVRFDRHQASTGETFPLVRDLQFEQGDYVAIGLENKHSVVESGFVHEVGPEFIVVTVKHKLRVPKDIEDPPIEMLRWRIDKDELYFGKRILKSNLMRLFQPEYHRLRELLVEMSPPRFVDENGKHPKAWLRKCHSLPGNIWSGRQKLRDVRSFEKVKALKRLMNASKKVTSRSPEHVSMINAYQNLNVDQRLAVSTVLAAQDYACIQGMPGTGKSTTLCFIIRALRLLGCSVLVCAYTHTAVDNILIKLKESAVPFVRVGKTSSVHTLIKEDTLEQKSCTVSDLQKLQKDPQLVVGATCLGVKHALIQSRKFDFCVIDEAGQITQPVCIAAMCQSGTFVLIGDDQQLPPLIKSEEAKKLGMDRSFLSELSAAHPECNAPLTLQFRMNKDIMKLANHLVYDHKLKCGNKDVETRRLHLPQYPNKDLEHTSGLSNVQWLHRVLNPDRSVVFLDTDTICCGGVQERRSITIQRLSQEDGLCSQRGQNEQVKKTRHHGKLENTTEASLTELLVVALSRCGVKLEDIGVISPYRSQLGLLKKQLARYEPQLEIQTVDNFQGRDKECIIVSLVRSNVTRDVGGLLRDWRRINVAFTRAKSKLFVIGSSQTLESSEVFSAFNKIVRANNWVCKLPFSAHLLYPNLLKKG